MEFYDKDIFTFIKLRHIKTENGIEVDFKNHKFLKAIYEDFSPKQAILKAAQIGFSTTEIIKSLWIARMKGVNIIYTLPTESDRNDFVGGKVNKIIANNPIFQEWTKDKDSVEQKQVGISTIYYRGTWSQKAAIMVSSDLNVYDELDSSKQSVIEQYSTRLQHSDKKWEWYFSHPSSEGTGIDRVWHKSTQNHWFITCQHCQEDQFMSWPESIDQQKEKFICKYCKKELSDDVRRNGKWRKKFKDREYQGYWIPLLICPWVSAKEILSYYKDKSEEYFYNKVLGLPYVGTGNKLTKAKIFQNLTEKAKLPERDDRVIIGLDTGSELHFVIGWNHGIFHYGSSKDYSEIEQLMKRWPRSIVVVDQGGDLIGSRKLREKYKGRVYLCSMGTDRKTLELTRWGKNDEDGSVVVDRNRIIQLVVDEFCDKRIPIFGTESDWFDYTLHWNDYVRTEKIDDFGQSKRNWVKGPTAHWADATIYWRIGMDRFGNKPELISSNTFESFNNAIEI